MHNLNKSLHSLVFIRELCYVPTRGRCYLEAEIVVDYLGICVYTLQRSCLKHIWDDPGFRYEGMLIYMGACALDVLIMSDDAWQE